MRFTAGGLDAMHSNLPEKCAERFANSKFLILNHETPFVKRPVIPAEPASAWAGELDDLESEQILADLLAVPRRYLLTGQLAGSTTYLGSMFKVA